MVVPGVMSPRLPCHEIVQPPDCRPMSSAPGPASRTASAGADAAARPARLEQDQRLGHRLAGERPVGVGADGRALPVGRHRVLEQAHLELDAQDPADRVVDPRRLDDVAAREAGPDGVLEARSVVRDHDHVDAGVMALATAVA